MYIGPSVSVIEKFHCMFVHVRTRTYVPVLLSLFGRSAGVADDGEMSALTPPPGYLFCAIMAVAVA